jgi:DNA-binding NtrC family response regulator
MSKSGESTKGVDESPIRVGKGLPDSRPKEIRRLLDHLRFGRYDELFLESQVLLEDLDVSVERSDVLDIRSAARAWGYVYEGLVKRGQGQSPRAMDAYASAKELIGAGGLTANYSRIERVRAYGHLMEYVIDRDTAHLERAVDAVGEAKARAIDLRREPGMEEHLVIRQLLECGTVRAEVALALGDPMTADRNIEENMPAVAIWELDRWNREAHRCVEALQYAYLNFEDVGEIEARFAVGYDRLEELNIAFDCAWYALHMGIRVGGQRWLEKARSGFRRLGNERLERVASELLEPRTVAIGVSQVERRRRLMEKIHGACALDPEADLLLVGEALEEAVEQLVDFVEVSTESVLIEGESGTGKSRLARIAHFVSGQYRTGSFERSQLNIGIDLVESAFFGHSKGAFTGANSERPGHFAKACGGTLFVDEVDKVSMEIHDKFLMAFDDGTYRRVGDGKQFQVGNTLMIFGASSSIQQLVDDGKMRRDHQYRFSQNGRIVVPSLRENGQLLAALARRFAAIYSERRGARIEVMPSALSVLGSRDWPGNVRELKTFMNRAVLVAVQRGENAITRDIVTRAFEQHDRQMLKKSAGEATSGMNASLMAQAMGRYPAFGQLAAFFAGSSALPVKLDELKKELSGEAVRHAESIVGPSSTDVGKFLGVTGSAIIQRRSDGQRKKKVRKVPGSGEADIVESNH